MTETTQPDPQVVAWMRGHLRENAGHDYIDATNAYFIAHPYDMTKDPPGMRAAYEAARAPLTVAGIPAGLFIDIEKHGSRSLRVLKFKDADGAVRGVPYGASLDPDAPERAALWALIEAHVPTVTAEDAP